MYLFIILWRQVDPGRGAGSKIMCNNLSNISKGLSMVICYFFPRLLQQFTQQLLSFYFPKRFFPFFFWFFLFVWVVILNLLLIVLWFKNCFSPRWFWKVFHNPKKVFFTFVCWGNCRKSFPLARIHFTRHLIDKNECSTFSLFTLLILNLSLFSQIIFHPIFDTYCYCLL